MYKVKTIAGRNTLIQAYILFLLNLRQPLRIPGVRWKATHQEI
ncbi:hypothetical protein LCGC14_0749280 [marine sediment metagenome]|uniref:Uncharacterized protein n=1 Tax=marine sediment metagenome TaxID=412755 RepID=A0A0F9TBH9_9ZZZZ